MANGNTENIRLGACNVHFGEQGSEEFLGLTIGGVEVEVSTETQQTMVDQYGDTVVKESIRGRNVSVSMQLAETTIQNMVALMPGATLLSTGGERAVVKTGVGIDLLSVAKSMILRPVEKDDLDTPANADKSEDFHIFRASTPGGLTFAYTSDSERVFNATFNAYPKENGDLFEYGDPSATA